MTKYDRWSRDNMPEGSTLRRIQNGIDATMRDVISDSRHGIPTSASMIPDRARSDEKPRPASGGTTEVKPPLGIDHIDRMCQAQDRVDKLAAMKVKLETDWLEFELGRSREPRIEHEYDPMSRENLDK
jgi:hypothetical protein